MHTAYNTNICKFIGLLSLMIAMVIPISASADNWILQSSGTACELQGVAYGNNTFVAVGSYGLILTSSDGIEWKQTYLDGNVNNFDLSSCSISSTSGARHNLWGVIYAKNTFVAFGAQCVILTSPDGITWTERYADDLFQSLGYGIYDVIYANGTFVTVGSRTLISNDGITWSQTTGQTSDIKYAQNMYVAVGISSILTSPDAIAWTERWPFSNEWWGNRIGLDQIFWANGTFIASGHRSGRWTEYEIDHFPGFRTFTSKDGLTWDKRKDIMPDKVVYGNNIFIGISTHGSKAWVSLNGKKWKQLSSFPYLGNSLFNDLRNIVYLHDTFIVTRERGTTITSRDGKTWTISSYGPSTTDLSLVRVNAVSFGNDRFIAVGEDGAILLSDPVILLPLPAPDLTGDLSSITQRCINSKNGLKCRLKWQVNIQNIGSGDASSSSVRFYLSDDAIYDGGDIFLTQVSSGKVQASMNKIKIMSYNLPIGINASGKYIFALIDADNTVMESNENNNIILYGPIP